MRRRRFRPSLDALEGRLPLDGDCDAAGPPPDAFDDPFTYPEDQGDPGATGPPDVDYGPADDAEATGPPADDPFGPDLEPTEPEPPDLDGDKPPPEYLPPAPIGPGGPL